MAVIRMGALASSIRKSSGGTTFRRHRGQTLMYNRPQGASKNKLLNTGGLPAIGQVLHSWQQMSKNQQDLWQTQTVKFPYPDAYGNAKYLSGKELYFKIANTCKHINITVPDPLDLKRQVFPIDDLEILHISNSDKLQIKTTDNDVNPFVLVQYEILPNFKSQPIYNRRKIKAYASFLPLNDTAEIPNWYADKAPEMKAGDNVRFYITPVDEFGFRGLVSVFNWVATA